MWCLQFYKTRSVLKLLNRKMQNQPCFNHVISKTYKYITSFFKSREQCLYNQIYDHFNRILSKIHYGFRKGFSTQYFLIPMIQKIEAES